MKQKQQRQRQQLRHPLRVCCYRLPLLQWLAAVPARPHALSADSLAASPQHAATESQTAHVRAYCLVRLCTVENENGLMRQNSNFTCGKETDESVVDHPTFGITQDFTNTCNQIAFTMSRTHQLRHCTTTALVCKVSNELSGQLEPTDPKDSAHPSRELVGVEKSKIVRIASALMGNASPRQQHAKVKSCQRLSQSNEQTVGTNTTSLGMSHSNRELANNEDGRVVPIHSIVSCAFVQ